jgi:hypothetical protein
MNEQTHDVNISGGRPWRLGSVANRVRIAAKDFADARDRRKAATPSIAERQAELVTFYDRFEKFVETLCDAAQYGPNPRLEQNYLDERNWIAEHFEPLRPFVGAFLSGQPDAFDRLTGAEDLGTFLSEDDGAVIFRITSARDSLSLYAEHLRQLAARKSA